MRKLEGLWLLSLIMLPSMAVGAGTPSPTNAPSPKSSSSPPPTATTATAPPPKASASPPTTSPLPPKASASPPPVTASSPPPKAQTPPPTASSSPPPKISTAPSPSSAVPPPKTAPPPVSKAAPPPKAANVSSPPPAATPKPSSPPPKKAPAPASSPSPSPSPASTPDFDPAQLAALRSLKVNFTKSDPCATSKDILLCDKTASPRHLIALSLKNCPSTAKLTTEALFNLSTLTSLQFEDCPMVPVHVPSVLVKSLTTFICTASLGKTGTNEKASKLSGDWLAKLTNLEEIAVTDVEVSTSGLNIITQGMKSVTQLIIARVNLPGVLPRKTWPAGVEYIDVSGNSIRGTLPSQMRNLAQLTHLDLSDNQLKGVLPNIFGDLSQLQFIDLAGNQFSGPIPGSLTLLHNCSHLDLSNNRLNGSILANITNMKTLRYLDLSQNELTGPVPFNSSFLSKLTTLKLNGNTGLCYNHTALKSKFLTGIPNCPSPADDSSLFAPAPAPGSSDVSSSSGGSHVSKGAAVGISVVAIVASAALVFVVRKWWKSREDPEQFVNLRAQRS